MSKLCRPAVDPALIPAFRPVPVKTLTGWTPDKQRGFIEVLAATGSVRMGLR